MTRTALIVIDIQNGMFGGAPLPALHEAESLLSNTSALLAAGRKAGLSIIYIQHCAYPGQVLIEGTEAWAIHSDIAPMKEDIVVLKKASSAFEETELHAVLKKKGIDTIISCGLQSEHCVTNTSISALELGFTVIVAKDCHSTFPTEDLSASTIVAQQNEFLETKGATVLPVSEIIKLEL